MTRKSYDISKRVVVEAWEQVKANKGSAGIDGESIEDFEKDLKNNLYKIWNRMSSGSYFPPAIASVEIPKKNGSTRRLGIPCVGDRVAQTVVKLCIESRLEKVFHKDSYGYRHWMLLDKQEQDVGNTIISLNLISRDYLTT